jgi:hypothetical protein
MMHIKLAGRHLGRRGAFLLAMGLAWICYGGAILATAPLSTQVDGLTLVTHYVSLHSLAWIWVASGVVGIAFCPVRRVGPDQWGFTALVIPAAFWSAGYLVDWIFVGQFSRGWVVATTYAAIAASIVIASGWPEARREAESV